MNISRILRILIAVLGAAALVAALILYLSEAGVPYDDVGAFFHLERGLWELLLAICGIVLLLASGLWTLILSLRKKH